MNIKKMLSISDAMIGNVVKVQENEDDNITIILDGKVNESDDIIQKKFTLKISPQLYAQNKIEVNDIMFISYKEDPNVETQKILSLHVGLFSLHDHVKAIENASLLLTLLTLFVAFILLFITFNASYYLTDRQFFLSALLSLTPSLFMVGISGLLKSYSQRRKELMKKYLYHVVVGGK